MNPQLFKRRQFLQMGIAGAGLFASGGLLHGQGEPQAVFNRLRDIGPLQEPDLDGIMLPPGFQCRVVARSGEAPAGLPGYTWHGSPDGGACFPSPDGGWVYVSNAELRGNDGGVGALRFDSRGEIVDAYPILKDTSVNCAGGATPWGTWLSCEEFDHGQVYECDPMGRSPAVVRPAMGSFKHEAAAVDLQHDCVYLTEDQPDGGFYRFVAVNGLPDLSQGRLEIASVVDHQGARHVLWRPLPDALAQRSATRWQVADYTPFKGGEGIALHRGTVYFTTKHDNRVWAYDTSSQRIEVLYDANLSSDPILSGVDNVVITPGGDVLVAEDGGDMQLVAITPELELLPLFQIVGHPRSELAGPAFDPSFSRLYISSQRGASGNRYNGGVTYEISHSGEPASS